MFGRVTIRLGIGPHSSLDYFVQHLTTDILETFLLDLAYIPNRKGAVAISFKWPEIELDGCIVWVAQ